MRIGDFGFLLGVVSWDGDGPLGDAPRNLIAVLPEQDLGNTKTVRSRLSVHILRFLSTKKHLHELQNEYQNRRTDETSPEVRDWNSGH